MRVFNRPEPLGSRSDLGLDPAPGVRRAGALRVPEPGVARPGSAALGEAPWSISSSMLPSTGTCGSQTTPRSGFWMTSARPPPELFDAPLRSIAVVGGASEALGQLALLTAQARGEVVLVASDFPSVTHPWLAARERLGTADHVGRGHPGTGSHGRARRTASRERHHRGVFQRGPVRDRIAGRRRRGRSVCACGRGAGDRRRHADGGSDAGEPSLVGCRRAGVQRVQVAVHARRRRPAGRRRRAAEVRAAHRRLEGRPASVRVRAHEAGARARRATVRALDDRIQLGRRPEQLDRPADRSRPSGARRTRRRAGARAGRRDRAPGLDALPRSRRAGGEPPHRLAAPSHARRAARSRPASPRSTASWSARRGDGIRVSLHAYNDSSDIDALAGALEQAGR